MKPLEVSVVIPAYNAERTIGRCLEALQNQTVAPLEIIVVDDGSTDSTACLASGKIQVIANSRSKGAGGARNAGAMRARGDIVAFIDSDCVAPRDWLEKICRSFQKEEVVAVAGGYSHHDGDSFIGQYAFLELARRRSTFPDYVLTATSNNFAVKREIFLAIGGFPEIFKRATLEDMILSFQVSRMGKIRWLRDNGVGHHFHDTYRGYLRQQFYFALDTVVTYWNFPEIIGARTHQGFLIYVETLLTGIAMLMVFYPPALLTFIVMIYLLNIFLAVDLYRKMGVVALGKLLAFIPIRNLNWVIGTLSGFAKIMTGKRIKL